MSWDKKKESHKKEAEKITKKSESDIVVGAISVIVILILVLALSSAAFSK